MSRRAMLVLTLRTVLKLPALKSASGSTIMLVNVYLSGVEKLAFS